MTTSPIHINDTWMETFTKLRMTAFGEAVIDIANNADYDGWTFSQKIAFALDKEVAGRSERRFIQLLKASQSPNPHACIEDLDCRPARSLNRELTTRLAHCQWIANATNTYCAWKIIGRQNLAGPSTAQCCMSKRLHRTVCPRR